MSDPKEENLHKEIDLIQGVITRLAQNATTSKQLEHARFHHTRAGQWSTC
jgi:hypothetical protein